MAYDKKILLSGYLKANLNNWHLNSYACSAILEIGKHSEGTYFVNTLKRDGTDLANNELIAIICAQGFVLDWQVNYTKGNDVQELPSDSQMMLHTELYARYKENPYKFLYYLGFSDNSAFISDSFRFIASLASSFVKALSKTPDIEILREKTIVEPGTGEITLILQSAPYIHGAQHLDEVWIKDIWNRLNTVFSAEIASYTGSVADHFASLNPDIHPAGRVFFHMVESKKEDYPFAFLATYSSGVANNGKSKHLPLKNALVEYKDDNKKLLELLSTVHKASEKSSFISELINSGELFHPIGLADNEAYIFLKEVHLYEEAGILCRIPNWWKNKTNSFKVSLSVGSKSPSHLGFDAIVDFNIQLSMGDETITIDDLRKLLAQTEGLAFIKGRWVEVNREKLTETLHAFEQAQKLMDKQDMSILEAMRLQFSAPKLLDAARTTGVLEITNGEWLNSFVAKLVRPEQIESISGGNDFHAELRTYQKKGLAWLYLMKTLGLGACLADDMGLGKTVQVIALLNYIRSQKNEKALLIIPASLIGNWMSEIQKFASSLRYRVLHPSEKNGAAVEDKELLEEYDLFITTYGMLSKYSWLKEVFWNTLILDEAQAIKNPGTKQTKTVKHMKAAYRIAMTGTPVENRLSDLWSLFDFLNKGLLGSAKEFTDFTKKLKDNQGGYSRLKQVVSPFILRRLKTDKTVISDLPDKIEMKTFSTLTKKQAALYNALVGDLKTKLESAAEGIERKGLIISSIVKFKQICNHPDQYLGQNYYAENESGKYERLREICETIYEKRERVLIFTQFKEITLPLSEFLKTVFRHEGLVLHGETLVAKRKEIVDRFQGRDYVPFLVLSIKAGGVGLNLTNANHVIHFDRWWNPAVENQATDRAFRIGQKKNVIVHKFITQGTIEEKIDLMIEEKTRLSNDIMPDLQENWITEMDNRQLMNLFTLSKHGGEYV